MIVFYVKRQPNVSHGPRNGEGEKKSYNILRAVF